METVLGKVAVVTGAASGIGRALTERFVAEGMSVVMADIEAPALHALAEELRLAGAQVEPVVTDVRDPASVQALAGAARARFGTFHVVCNNAGVAGHLGRLWETSLEDYRWVLDVNLWGVIHGIRSFVPHLVQQREGHVVNTASLAGWMSLAALGPYITTKHAVLGLSETLRRELDQADVNVGVSVLCPNIINTQIIHSGRNWPGELGAEPTHRCDPVSAVVTELLTAGTTGGGLEPSVAADVVLQGILTDTFFITTHPDDVVAAASHRLTLAETGALSEGLFSPAINAGLGAAS